MQQDQLANGNYAQYLAHALTPPILGASGIMGGYGGTQGIGPQFGSPQFGNPQFGNPQFGNQQFGDSGFGQFGQGLPGQGNTGTMPGGVAVQPGIGYQGMQLAMQQQQQIAATLHQLAHQAATQAMLGQQIAAVLNQLAHQCTGQVQTALQNRYGGLGTQAGGGLYGQPFGYGLGNTVPFAQAWGHNRPSW